MTTFSGTDKIINAKSKLDEALKNFVVNYKNCNGDKMCVSQIIGEVVSCHTKVLNTVNQVLVDLHEEYNFFDDKNLQRDFAGTVENFIPISLRLIQVINDIAKKDGVTEVTVSPKAYVTIQSFGNTFFDKQTIVLLKSKFTDMGLSISGFNQKFRKPMKGKFLKQQLWLGVPLLLICGAAILFGEKLIGSSFNGIQLIFLKALMALTISIVASSLIEGNATVKWSLQKGLAIRAVGWVAVFLLLYFLNPASPGDVH